MAAPGRPGPLSDLVAEVNARGVSYQRMADRSADQDGNRLSKAFFQRLAVGGVASAPVEEELAKIARALAVPLRIVQEAAARQWLGYVAEEVAGYDADVRQILVRVEEMAPLERRRLRAMLDAADAVRDSD